MSTTNRPVTSREYKLMLNVDRFQDRGHGSEVFFHLLDFLVTKEGQGTINPQNKEERRLTSYWDTPDLALRQKGFALRLREEEEGRFQINLKYRGPDRYLSACQDLSGPESGEPKFEEDVLPPFVSKFAHSITVKTTERPDLSTVEKVVSLFPGLVGLDLDAGDAMSKVKGFEALEVVRKLCKFQFGEPVDLKASLSFWYLPGNEAAWPMVAEFSFDYDAPDAESADRLETYPRRVVEGANRLFGSLQNQAGWVNLNLTTKTAFALEAL